MRTAPSFLNYDWEDYQGGPVNGTTPPSNVDVSSTNIAEFATLNYNLI